MTSVNKRLSISSCCGSATAGCSGEDELQRSATARGSALTACFSRHFTQQQVVAVTDASF